MIKVNPYSPYLADTAGGRRHACVDARKHFSRGSGREVSSKRATSNERPRSSRITLHHPIFPPSLHGLLGVHAAQLLGIAVLLLNADLSLRHQEDRVASPGGATTTDGIIPRVIEFSHNLFPSKVCIRCLTRL
ncbi:hypothetical protein GY45DRAFT_1066845 [Cubamyces sp. BRFM 1775]|nr:hypothetical protein GY45DRAFT_1066845 [Cubamyces sp. BRFM 1775]